VIHIKGGFKRAQKAEDLRSRGGAARLQGEWPAARISQPNPLWHGHRSSLDGNLCFIRDIGDLRRHSDRRLALWLPASQFLPEMA